MSAIRKKANQATINTVLNAKQIKTVKEVQKKEIIKEVTVQVDKIRTEKKEKKILANKVIEKPKPVLKIGDRVRMFDGKAIGSIDKIEKNKATVNYGVFTSTVSIDVLEFVESKK